uniref:Carbonic anhydrase 4 n=1 Tax=Cyprinus carpio TaxID=7962 RepID=A0A8C1WJ83_CYPCA
MKSLELITCLIHYRSKVWNDYIWCYQTQVSCQSNCTGPDRWSDVYAECGKSRQSPINIVTKKTKLDERLTPFKFTGYQTVFETTVSGGNLGETYKAVQFHLHWGTNGGPGSEHTIDGEQYPMEVRPTPYQSEETFFNKFVSLNTHSCTHITRLSERIFLTCADGNTTLSKISLNQLILSEANMTNYYRYDGSLTTPGCTEGQAIIKEKTISRLKLLNFAKKLFADGEPMVGTFRPVQPRNGRVVYRSSGVVVIASAVLILVSISAALGLSRMN